MALIPARSGSVRVPTKNIKELGGIPLMAWSILVARACRLINEVIVSTNDLEYGRIALDWGAETLIRPDHLATAESTDFGVVKHLLEHYQPDLIVYLRPTTPFRTSELVDDAIRLMSVPGYDSLRSVEEMVESAWKCFRIKAGLLKPLTKTDYTDKANQTLPKTYHPNGYVDIIRSEIVRQGFLWGAGRYAFVTPRTVEIDTPEDFEYAEWRVQKGREFNYAKAENR